MILPEYISCIKRAGSTLHWVVQTGQDDLMPVQYMLYRLGSTLGSPDWTGRTNAYTVHIELARIYTGSVQTGQYE